MYSHFHKKGNTSPVNLFLEHVLVFKANSSSRVLESYGGSLKED